MSKVYLVYVCMSTVPVSLCPMSSAWLCPIKQRQRAQTLLKTTKMKRRRKTLSWSRRLHSTTTVWIMRRLKRWWTEGHVAPVHKLPAFSLSILFFFLYSFMERRPCRVRCRFFVRYFAPFFLVTPSPPSGGRLLLLFCCAWSPRTA